MPLALLLFVFVACGGSTQDGAIAGDADSFSDGGEVCSRALLAPGEVCAGSTDPLPLRTCCGPGYECKRMGQGYHPSSYCLRQVGVGQGEHCNSQERSLNGAWDEGGILHVCNVSDLRCIDDVCAKRQELGGPCGDPANTCNGFVGLHCDVPSRTCVPPAPAGAWCEEVGDCVASAYCDGWDPRYGTVHKLKPGECRTKGAPGTPCTISWECASGACLSGKCG